MPKLLKKLCFKLGGWREQFAPHFQLLTSCPFTKAYSDSFDQSAVLTNRQTGKLNFDTCYIINLNIGNCQSFPTHIKIIFGNLLRYGSNLAIT